MRVTTLKKQGPKLLVSILLIRYNEFPDFLGQNGSLPFDLPFGYALRVFLERREEQGLYRVSRGP